MGHVVDLVPRSRVSSSLSLISPAHAAYSVNFMGGRHSHSGQAAFCGIAHDGGGEQLSTRHPRLGNGVLSPPRV